MELTQAEQQDMSKAATENPDAYRLYLLARHEFDQGDYTKAADDYQQAINKDPTRHMRRPTRDLASCRPSRRATTLPLKRHLFPRRRQTYLAEAHLAQADLELYEWYFSGAETDCHRALALDPNFLQAYVGCAVYLELTGQFSEAENEFRRSLALDPLYLAETNGWVRRMPTSTSAARRSPRRRRHSKSTRTSAQHTAFVRLLHRRGKIRPGCGCTGKAGDSERVSEAAMQMKQVYAKSGIEGVYRARTAQGRRFRLLALVPEATQGLRDFAPLFESQRLIAGFLLATATSKVSDWAVLPSMLTGTLSFEFGN